MDISILFMVFNRPHLANLVFEEIRSARPARLYVMADGPRGGVDGDEEKCIETRKILERVDWECEVRTLFFDENKGCEQAVISGINWLFQNEDRGIILEDDCLPDPTFFPYCEELLECYQDDTRIMHINGNNFNIREFTNTRGSYCFGSYPQAWGWATWRRAWALFDESVTCWPELKSGGWLDKKGWSFVEKRIQQEKYDYLYRNKTHETWDYQWHLSVYSQNGLAIVPNTNLISNIGFGRDATHTINHREECSSLTTSPLYFPLNHPTIILPDPKVDKIYRKIMIGNTKTLFRIMMRKARRFVAGMYRKMRCVFQGV